MAQCLRRQWTGHFNQRDYSGEWTSIALGSGSGRETDIASVPDQAGYRDTPLVDECAHFKEEEARAREMRLGTRRLVIETLRARGTPMDLRLAEELDAAAR